MLENPIYELVNDETFARLHELGLLNEIAVRDVGLKQRFVLLRVSLGSSTAAIAELARQEYRSFSQVRKVIYRRSPLDELVSAGGAGEQGKA